LIQSSQYGLIERVEIQRFGNEPIDLPSIDRVNGNIQVGQPGHQDGHRGGPTSTRFRQQIHPISVRKIVVGEHNLEAVPGQLCPRVRDAGRRLKGERILGETRSQETKNFLVVIDNQEIKSALFHLPLPLVSECGAAKATIPAQRVHQPNCGKSKATSGCQFKTGFLNGIKKHVFEVITAELTT
jgi:hypothetical protein